MSPRTEYSSIVVERRDSPIYIDNLRDFLCQAGSNFEAKWPNIQGEDNLLVTQFDLIQTIGTGGYGRVVLCQKDGKYSAMKILSKANIILSKQIERVRNEKQILMIIRFPFVSHCLYYFQDNSHVYLVLPFFSGGDLFDFIKKHELLSENVARCIASQVVLGLEYLHSLSLIHRDIKPENIVIDWMGFIKIIDFGFAKFTKARTYSMCGTPEYLAPEVILSKGYGESVDWWALGVLIYEMCSGTTPFYSRDRLKTFEMICAGHVNFYDHFSNDMRDIIYSLLSTDVTKRLGCLKGQARDIKNHRWFFDISWKAMLNKEERLPYKTGLNNEFDFHNLPQPTEETALMISKHDKYKKEFENF